MVEARAVRAEMSEEIKADSESSGMTGHFDLDEMGLSDDELDVLRSKRKSRENKGDGWSEWGDDPWSGDEEQQNTWAVDHKWSGEEKPENEPKPESGTAAIDLNELRKRQAADTALSLDEGGADEWDEGWDAGGWSTNNTDSTSALDISTFTLGSKEKGVEGAKRNRIQAADLYERGDDSNYRAGQFLTDGSSSSSGLSFRSDDEYDRRDDLSVGVDNTGWSSNKLVDEDRHRHATSSRGSGGAGLPGVGSLPSGGGEATAAIDLSAFTSGASAPEPPPPMEEVGVSRAPACLVIFAPEAAQPVQFELRRGVTTIGRGFDNNIVLSDVFASRKHSLVLKRGAHFEVQDANSDNGTTVNGHPVAHARLKYGDHIEIGSTFLRFTSGTPTPQELMASSPPQRLPHHLAPAPARRKGKGMSTAMVLVLFSVFMLLIVTAGVALFLQYG